ncbi:C5a anaphylatoxin chemotactic receptor 1 [Pygocentrus nattereri]|uniref:G-protein coupled receptors family 1 profile domain-containing protein n=1 Tax=Pygocentrus nattereri TaxID=42514 RepID=A0A3B4E0D1_PYGNA|nr:C5a anaphylatoxin chemotactic receptor 1 [Pygocentrus nattereri]
MNWTTNITESEQGPWARIEKPLLLVILSIEMVLGILGNGLVLCVKAVCRDQFQCVHWVPFVSLTLSDFFCAVLIINGSLLAILNGGQRSPWCEVVSLFKFTFITSSIGSVALLCIQPFLEMDSNGKRLSVITATVCLASWLMGVVFGTVPVIYDWVRYDPSEMLCAVFWETSYSDMLVYILCAFSVSIFPQVLIIITCSFLTSAGYKRNSISPADLSSVTPLLVVSYMLCYTPFAVSEMILLARLDLSPSPEWLRTLASIMAYLDCSLNPIIYCTNQGFREALLALLWNKRKSGFPEPVLTCMKKLEI